MHGHIVNHIKHPLLTLDNNLHVVLVMQNPVRYHSILRLFRQTVTEMLATPNVVLHVVEAVFKDRQGECAPEPGQDYSYLSVNISSEIWLKENLINLAEEHLLPRNWRYMALVDADITFRDPGWALATIHQLQHYNLVQPWQSGSDLDFYGNVMDTWTSFGSLCAQGKAMWHGKGKDGYKYAHTGYAWACNRYYFENVRKLADFCIVGAGDHLMAWACLGRVDETMPKHISAGYRSTCEVWQIAAQFASAGIVGYTPGRIEHHFHGPKKNRQYWNRWDILIANNYNPYTDIAYDSQGVVILVGKNKYAIEHAFMKYNRQRLSDSIES